LFEYEIRKNSLSSGLSANTTTTNMANQYKIDLDDEGLGEHDKKAFAKCCEILTFLIRDMAHITLQNFEGCIHCLRTFVEACVLGDRSEETKKENVKKALSKSAAAAATNKGGRLSKQKTQMSDSSSSSQLAASANAGKRSSSPKYEESDEDDQFITSYETLSIQVRKK
jgi:hypothetical protein